MNPPTEQLVRDYLNRLSVAARGKLGSKERQILLDRTRMRIEAECGGVGAASAAAVRQVLARLGDPISLVDAERGASVSPAVVAAGAGPFLEAPVSREDPTPDKTPASRGGSGRDGAGSSPLVPLVPRPASSPDPLRKSARKGADTSGSGTGGSGTGGSGTGGSGTGGSGTGGSGTGGSGTGGSASAGSGSAASDPGGAGEEETGPEADTGDFHVEAIPATEIETGPNRVAEAADAAISFISRVVLGIGAVARRHKLETAAVILLGVGGAVFPPVWVIGALIAIGSKVWDLRDKWLGIGLPVLVVIVGTAAILVVGGQRHTLGSYAMEVWIGAGRLCRLMAVIGAGYLLWRLRQGRRRRRQPPWNVPHKLDL